MEMVLDVYKRPLDSRYPVVCMDESPKQLIAETRVSIPASPGQLAKHDYEYRRCGVCNIFIACEPLVGKRMVTVTERKTKQVWACFLEEIAGQYESAEKITLVMDNLNTHAPGSLYETFPPDKALAILAQEEFAKAYIIRLVQEGAIPWCDEILKATRNHHCTQLMGILMEYLFTSWDTDSLLERERRIKERFPDFLLTRKVSDALNIFCHEKIGRWKSSSWFWAEDPKYDVEAKKVWKGKIEKTKQNALYVSIGKDGRVTNIPRSDSDDVNKQIEYAEVLEEVASGHDCFAFTEKEYIKAALKEIFDNSYEK